MLRPSILYQKCKFNPGPKILTISSLFVVVYGIWCIFTLKLQLLKIFYQNFHWAMIPSFHWAMTRNFKMRGVQTDSGVLSNVSAEALHVIHVWLGTSGSHGLHRAFRSLRRPTSSISFRVTIIRSWALPLVNQLYYGGRFHCTIAKNHHPLPWHSLSQ